MDSLNDQLADFDPDLNYYESAAAENQIFSTYNAVDEFISKNESIYLSNSDFITIFSQNIRSMNRNLDNFLLLFSINR